MNLSIITINYNNKSGLQKTLDSVLAQTCKDFEWIVIDGGSTDGSKDLIEQHQDSMAYWCSEPDRGIYHAMNKGIAKAKGDYLQFLNSGDVLSDEKVVSEILPYLRGFDIYMGNMYFASRVGVPVVNPESVCNENILHTLVFKAIMHPSTYIKRECFMKFGYYDEHLRICSDWWFFYEAIVKYNASISYIPVVVTIFDETGISSTQRSIIDKEKQTLWEKNIAIGQLTKFYQNNYDIVKALKSNKLVFYIFRLYFFLFRKLTVRN